MSSTGQRGTWLQTCAYESDTLFSGTEEETDYAFRLDCMFVRPQRSNLNNDILQSLVSPLVYFFPLLITRPGGVEYERVGPSRKIVAP